MELRSTVVNISCKSASEKTNLQDTLPTQKNHIFLTQSSKFSHSLHIELS